MWSVLNEFKAYGELISETNDLGITLVRLGDFSDINEAKSVASEIRKKKWFENAGVYLYKNGKYSHCVHRPTDTILKNTINYKGYMRNDLYKFINI